VEPDWDEPLRALKWNWDEAYIISRPEPGVWIAERRDNHETLRDETPFGLREKIIADYAERPVRRDGAP
jgi:hypothetical protein